MMGTIQQQLPMELTGISSSPAANPNSTSAFAAVLLEMGAAQPTPPVLLSPNSSIAPPSSVPEATEGLEPLGNDGSRTDGDLAWAAVPSSVPLETIRSHSREQMQSSGFGTANAPLPVYAPALEGSLEQSRVSNTPPEELFDPEAELSFSSIVGMPPAVGPTLQGFKAAATGPETTNSGASASSIDQAVEQGLRLQIGKTLGAASKHGLNFVKMHDGGSNAQPTGVSELLSQQQPADFSAAAVLQFIADHTGSNTLSQIKGQPTSVAGGEQIGTSLVDVDTNQLDSLMREISEVAGKTGRAAFRMTSEHLGGLEVRLQTQERGVSVTIRTESEQSHTALSQAQKQLTDDLRANGLRVAETSVALGRDNSEQDRSQRSAKQPSIVQIETAMVDLEQDESPINARASGRFA